jgi:ubiquinone/menaquinone biosynthesis C-methylase UbiE
LFAWLAGVCVARELAWDCGCGSGQASVPLAGYFDQVHATDIAPEQIAEAKPHPRVNYLVAPADHSALRDVSVDLVTVAQALHWFDLRSYYAEVRRVARPGALFAIWTYPRPEFADPALDRVFLDFYSNVVGPYWPPERRHVESHYATLEFPPKNSAFEEVPHPEFAIALDWSFEQVIGYASSWSATARYQQQKGTDPVPLLSDAMRAVWPGSRPTAALRMPLVLRAARLRGP